MTTLLERLPIGTAVPGGDAGTATTTREPRACLHGGLHEHGTRACYQADECRCLACERANTEYQVQRNRLIAAGEWAPLVDAGPVAIHVRDLVQAGVQAKHVAQLAVVSVPAVYRLLADGTAPAPRRVRAETARRLLAVQAPAVDATGARRRLQALVAIGWPPALLDPHLGEEPGSVERLLHAEAVSHTTAGQVARLFEQLWDSPPPQHSEDETRAADDARARAKRHGWGPPMAWDEELNPIDDPAAEPDLGEPVRRRAKLPPAEELQFLLDAGESPESIARRFGVKPAAVKRALQRDREAAPDEPASADPRPETRGAAA